MDGLGMENVLSPDFFPGPGQARSPSPGAFHLLGPPGPPQANIRFAPSRAQPCRLVTMTSVVKTVYTLQPPAVQSGGLPAGGYQRRPADSRRRPSLGV